MKKHILAIGTGFATLEFVFHIILALAGKVEVTVIAKSDTFVFVPNWIFVPFGRAWNKITLSLGKVFARRGIRFIHGTVTAVDTGHKHVELLDGRRVSYDKLVIGTGGRLQPEIIPGLKEYGQIMATREGGEGIWSALKAFKKEKSGKRILVVNPGGHFCAGPLYEMVFMVESWLRKNNVRHLTELSVYTRENRFIAAFGPGVHDRTEQMLASRNISAKRGIKLIEVKPGVAVFESGEEVPFDLLISLSPQASNHFGLPHNEAGFIRVDHQTMQVVGEPDVYAIGDCNNFPLNQGYLAMLQANTVVRHLQREFGETADFQPLVPVTMCIMYQGDTATFAQTPLVLTGRSDVPITVDQSRPKQYLVGTSVHWKVCKHLLGASIMASFRFGYPFHGGLLWKIFFEPCLKVTTTLLARRAGSEMVGADEKEVLLS